MATDKSTKPKTAAAYIAEAQKQRGVTAPAASSAAPIKFQGGDVGEPQSPLNWIMDILSRGVHATTNVSNSGSERLSGAVKKARTGDIGGAVGDALFQVLPTTPVGDMLTGLTSTKKDDQRLWADSIEHQTDNANSAIDPKYVDVDDNVNPVAKGVLGFVGDVALDPLNLIPGVAYTKAATGIKALVGAGTVAAKGAAKAAKSATKKAANEASHVEVTPATAAEDIVSRIRETEAAKAPDPLAESRATVDSVLGGTAATGMRSKLKSFDDAAMEVKVPVRPRSTSVEAVAKVVESDVPAAVTGPARSFREWAREADDFLLEVGPKEMPSVAVSGAKVPLNRAVAVALKGDKAAIQGLRQFYEDVYLKSHKGGAEQGAAVDLLGRWEKLTPGDITQAARVVDDSTDLSDATAHARQLREDPEYARERLEDALSSYRPGDGPVPTLDDLLRGADEDVALQTSKVEAAEQGLSSVTRSILTARGAFVGEFERSREALDAVFGENLVTNLYRNAKESKQDARFEAVVTELKGILDRSIDLHEIEKILPASGRMLNQLGIDFNALPKVARQMQDTANTTPPPRTMDEIQAMLGGDLPPDTVDAVKKGLHNFLVKEKFEVDDKTLYRYTTNNGVKVTHPADVTDGVGNIRNEVNQFAQANVLFPILTHFTDKVKAMREGGTVLAGSRRANYLRQNVLPAARLAEEVLDRNGIPLVVGINTEKRLPLAFTQVLDILDEVNAEGMNRYFWNYNTAVAPTNLMEAAYIAARGGRPDEIEAAIRNAQTTWSKKGITNNIADPVIREGKNGKKYSYGTSVQSGDQLVAGLLSTIQRATPTLQRAVVENAERFQRRGVEETTTLIDDSLNMLAKVFEEGTVADLLKGIDGNVPRILKAADERGTTSMAKGTAAVTATEMIPTVDRIIAGTQVKAEQAMVSASKASTGKVGKKKGQVTPEKAFNDAARAALPHMQKQFDEISEETLKALDRTVDLDGQTLAQLNGSWFRKQFIKVNRETQMKLMHEKVVGNENLWRDINGRVATKLNGISRRIGGRDRFQQVFHSLQKGIPLTDESLAPFVSEVDDLVSQIFGRANSSSLMDNAFIRNGANIEHINAAISRYVGDDYLFDAGKAADDAAEKGTSLMEEAAQQWKDWDVRDPAGFINSMYTAMSKVAIDQNIALHWFNLAKEHGAVSSVPKKGFSRLVSTEGKSVFQKYIPEGLYFDDNIADMLHAADVLTQQTLGLATKHGEFGRFMAEVYKPVQDMWKTGMTVINPAHHVRNSVSDASLTFLAEGWTAKDVYKRALHVMGTHNSYDNWDAIAAINGIGEALKPGRVVAKTKFGEITDTQLYSELANRGNLPTFRVLEALEDEGAEISGALGTWWKKQGHTRPMRAVGGVTEARDHYFRVAHALQILDNPKYAKEVGSLDELFDLASARVRKWHPDGSDLTSTEQAFKLIIPFYSWQRKSIPLIVESLLTKPQRVTVFPKATYNMAVAMGINPDSLADPFPEDQMFPSYLKEQMHGPAFEVDGKYYGINPGFASSDVLSDFVGANPLRTVAGSVSPLIRTPWELLTGGQVGTGSRINDTSDFIDSQLPLVGPTSRITGNSVTGSLLGLVSGQGLDPQFQIAAGNKDPGVATTTALINYLTGMGITPMSQDNQINYAEIEKRNREGAK